MRQRISALCVILGVASFGLSMPGRHSPEKLLVVRRQRAIERGYVRARNTENDASVLVPREVAPRAAAIVRSLSLQFRHGQMVGGIFPTGRATTRAAKPLLRHRAYKDAMRVHDGANLAKHRWADFDELETIPEHWELLAPSGDDDTLVTASGLFRRGYSAT